jgi:nitrogen fixation/metabolism regulation signal transduction histidine kinase
MSETTLEESDPFLKQELEEIKQELLSILANVESVTEAMNRAILKEEDRREQFRTLCSLIDHSFGENIKMIEKRKDDLKEIDPSLQAIDCKLSTSMERLRNVAIRPDLKSMKVEMKKVLSQQRIEKFQTNPQQEEQRPQKG